jgi:aryl-alcohol dehydrogenase-like predicted oxidoreductase
MDRRKFFKAAAAAGLASQVPLTSVEASAGEPTTKPGPIAKRPLGKTGEHLSVIGFGGIVVSGVEQDAADRAVREAVEAGVNYFDVAPSYGDAEVKLGPALQPFREGVFLACKTARRTKDEAFAELRASLQRLRTDHLDLYQLHALSRPQDVETAFGPGGAMEAFIEAKRQGLTRYLGFSAHSVEAALTAMDRYDFDTLLFPFNFVCWHRGDFGPQVLERARSRGVAPLALKAMALSPWAKDAKRTHPKCWYQPISDREEASLGLRFTLSQPVTAAIPPGDGDLFRLALDLARSFVPLSPEEQKDLQRRAETLEPIFRHAT